MSDQTYYLSSMDSITFADTRECHLIKPMKFRSGKKCLLVNVSPPVPGNLFGANQDFSTLVLTHRFEGDEIYPIKELPIFVHIAAPQVADIERYTTIDIELVKSLAWGELYGSRHAADNHIIPRKT